jgi:hypothetical protein
MKISVYLDMLMEAVTEELAQSDRPSGTGKADRMVISERSRPERLAHSRRNTNRLPVAPRPTLICWSK